MGKLFCTIFCLCLISAGVFYSCKKDPPLSPGSGDAVTHFNKTTLDYCFFKPGSWWVYEDSVSGKRDSVYVTSSSLNNDTVTEEDNVGYTGIFERFYVYMDCSYLSFTQKQYAHSAQFRYWDHEDVSYYRTRIGYGSGTEALFTNKIQNGFVGGDWPGYYTSMGLYDSMKVGNIWFKSVAPFYNNENEAVYNLETYMHFARNIGLIKKVIPDSNQNWILVNYNIVQ